MKNFIVIVSSLYISLISAQEENKFRLRSLDAGFGIFYNEFTFNNTDYTESTGGLCFNSQLTTSLKNNLFALSYLGGEEFDIFGTPSYSFHNFNLFYGRALELTKWLHLEGFAGIGYFLQSHSFLKSYSQLAYPLKFNMVFLFNGHKGLSLSGIYLIGQQERLLSVNISYYYKFK
jgi:hypothetical protein